MAIVRATQPFAFTDTAGVPRVVRAGDLYDETDPNVKGRENLFEPVETAASRTAAVVETATAAPGEKRSLSRRKTIKEPAGDGTAAPADA